MGKLDFLQHVIPVSIIGACIAYGMERGIITSWIRETLGMWAVCNGMHLAWYVMDVHKRFGPWSCSEPTSHLRFAMESSWIVLLFSLQNRLWLHACGFTSDPNVAVANMRVMNWELPVEYHPIKSTTLASDIFWGLVFVYVLDFWRYVAHRVGHYSFFFKTFPFAHAHHHNQLFVHPLTTFMSPLAHLASWGTFLPLMFMGSIGLHRASLIAHVITTFPTLTQHMGCDPLPWLTRFNHYYCMGAIPWIPMYHAYHHNPFVKTGCFGNTTAFFDYLFDSVQPECIYHIENGHMCEKLADRFKDEKQLGVVMNSMMYAGKGKNRYDLNEHYNWNIFSMNFK